jgi:hypothetical protein
MPAQRLRVALAAAPRVIVAENLATLMRGAPSIPARDPTLSPRGSYADERRVARNASQRETRP